MLLVLNMVDMILVLVLVSKLPSFDLGYFCVPELHSFGLSFEKSRLISKSALTLCGQCFLSHLTLVNAVSLRRLTFKPCVSE